MRRRSTNTFAIEYNRSNTAATTIILKFSMLILSHLQIITKNQSKNPIKQIINSSSANEKIKKKKISA